MEKKLEIGQKTLDAFKRHHPNDPQIQAVTLADVGKNAEGRNVAWNSIILDEAMPPGSATEADQSAACHDAIATVVIDSILWAIGAVPLRGKIKAATVRKVARATQPMRSKLERIIAKMAVPGAKIEVLFEGAVEILEEVRPALGKILEAFTSSLSWWDRVLYGLVALAHIGAFVLAEPFALPAEILEHAGTLGFLISDCAKAVQTCKSSQHH